MSKGRIKNRFRYLVGDRFLWLKRVNLHERGLSSAGEAIRFSDESADTHLYVYKRGRLVGSLELKPFLMEWEEHLLERHPGLPNTRRTSFFPSRAIIWLVHDLPEMRKLNAALLKAALGTRKASTT